MTTKKRVARRAKAAANPDNDNGWKWLTIRQAADALGMSSWTIYAWTRHKKYPLEFKKTGRDKLVRINDIQAWAKAHECARSRIKMKKPAPGEPPPDATPKPKPPIQDGVMAVLSTVDFNEGSDVTRNKISLAASLRLEIDAALKRQKLMDPEDVVKMLRSMGVAYETVIQERTEERAKWTVIEVQRRTALDMQEGFAGIVPVLVQLFGEWDRDVVFPAINRAVDEATESVKAAAKV